MSQIFNCQVIAVIEFNFLTLKNITMKKILFIAFAAFLFTQCTTDDSSDDALLTNMDDVQIETRSQWGVWDGDAINTYGRSIASCEHSPVCEDYCYRRIDPVCKTFGTGSDLICEADVDAWTDSLIDSQEELCGFPSYTSGFCNIDIEVDKQAVLNNVFRLCVTGTLWACPKLTEAPMKECEKMFDCVSVTHMIQNDNVIPEFTFFVSNNCDEAIVVTLGNTTYNVGGQTGITIGPYYAGQPFNLVVGDCIFDTYIP